MQTLKHLLAQPPPDLHDADKMPSTYIIRDNRTRRFFRADGMFVLREFYAADGNGCSNERWRIAYWFDRREPSRYVRFWYDREGRRVI